MNQSIGPVMADIAGLELSREDREVLAHPLVGGVILFARNYTDPAQLARLCAELHALKPDGPRLLLAVDHEGGRVQRFRVGFTRIPAMGGVGETWKENETQALADAFRHGQTIGRELSAFGIDLSFSPVLDLDHGNSQIIGDRAFSKQTDVLVTLARRFRAGLNDSGHAATGKHFPGHGFVAADSHHELPVDMRTLEQLEAQDLAPFQALIDDGIESLMIAHIRYSRVDATPASLSKLWLQDVLRQKMGYDGAIFCDDLSMGGVLGYGGPGARALAALDAGCDMVLVCNDRPATLDVLAALDKRGFQQPERASARLERLFTRAPAVSLAHLSPASAPEALA